MEGNNAKKLKPIFHYAKKRKRRLAIFGSLLSLVVLLGVNVYAWFVYIAKSDLTLSANVLGWTVTFSDGASESDSFDINVVDAYPGMNDFQKRIYITNSGELNSTFRYEIESINMFGQNVIDSNLNQEAIIEGLKTTYPFSIDFTFSGNKMSPGESITFDTKFTWKYENDKEYFKLDKYHVYDKTIQYYKYDGINYKLEEVDASSFDSKKSSLYMYRDDADGFFGIRCADYERKNNKSCVSIRVKLYVEQVE